MSTRRYLACCIWIGPQSARTTSNCCRSLPISLPWLFKTRDYNEKGNTSPTLQFIYALHGIGFNMQYLLYGRDQAPPPRDFPPEMIRYVSEAVTQFEQKFAGGALSNETRLRMMLVLLGQYVEQPSTMPLTEAQARSFLARS